MKLSDINELVFISEEESCLLSGDSFS